MSNSEVTTGWRSPATLSLRPCAVAVLLLVVTVYLLTPQPNLLGQASALDFQRLRPRTPTPDDTPTIAPPATGETLPAESPRVLDRLDAIILIDDSEALAGIDTATPEGVVAAAGEFVALPALAESLDGFIGKPLTLADIETIRETIIRHFRRHDRPVVDVRVPEQEVTGGGVAFLVTEGRVGRILAEGQEWFPAERLTGAVRELPGETISATTLVDDMNWLNRNPFRRSELLFRKGSEQGETDLVVKTRDRLPFRPYVGFDNAGTVSTGEERWSFGFSWGNAFWLDQILAYQFTVGTDPNRLQAHAATWEIPLPWRHVLQLYGSVASSDFQFAPLATLEQETSQLGTRYVMPLRGSGQLKHEARVGFDFKNAQNDLLFGDLPVFSSDTNIAQFVVGYEASLVDSLGRTKLSADWVFSPGGLISGNDDADFATSRAFAESNYHYGRLRLERNQRLPLGFTLTLKAGGQLSSGNLLRSEQFSLGGATTVRGFVESAADGDHGWLASAELVTPAISPLELCGVTAVRDELRLLAFIDSGAVGSSDRLPGEPSSRDLVSAGLGLRYALGSNLSVRFDYGWQIVSDNVFDPDNSRAHLSIFLSY